MAIHKSLKGLFGGDGMAWRREQKDILDWAKNLYYPESGGSLIPETDDKATWDAWKNKFLSWKDAEVNKEASGNAWWQTYPRSLTTGGEESGGGSDVGGLINYQQPTIPLVYPMTMPEYSPSPAQDFSAYMPADSIFGGQRGLLYQPFSQEYLQQYVPQGLINYTPPEINGMMPVYRQNPIGLLDVIAAAEELVGEEGGGGGGNNNTSTSGTPFEERGGKMEGDVGYNASNPAYGYVDLGHLVDDMSNLAIGYDNLANMYGYDDAGKGKGKGQGNTPGKSDNPADASSAGGAGFSFS